MTVAPVAHKGVIPAVLTPLDARGRPDMEMLRRHCRWLLSRGADGLGLLGTTGEANSFCLKERVRIIEGVVESGIPGERLLPGTGACALPDAIALTRVAVEAGAGGVLMLPPFYYKNPTDDGLFAFFDQVIQEIGDSRLRIYLYHFPQMSAVPISYGLIERLIKAHPRTVVGMKDSSGDFENMKGAVKRFPGFAVFPGSDELLLPLLKEGGAGCITACCNVVSQTAAEVWSAFRAGHDASEGHARLAAARKAITAHPLQAALKAIMARMAGDEAWDRLRPPLVSLDASQRAKLFAALDSIGIELRKAA